MNRGTSKLGPGKASIRWELEIRPYLTLVFGQRGITSCELKIPTTDKWPNHKCFKDNWLSYAHGKKRRHCTDRELVQLVVLGCMPCHNIIEYELTHGEMLIVVKNIIELRGWIPDYPLPGEEIK